MNKTFEQEFQDRLKELEKQAAEVGETLTSICRATGISRATPDRWKRQAPNTVLLLDTMFGHIQKRRQELVSQALISPSK